MEDDIITYNEIVTHHAESAVFYTGGSRKPLSFPPLLRVRVRRPGGRRACRSSYCCRREEVPVEFPPAKSSGSNVMTISSITGVTNLCEVRVVGFIISDVSSREYIPFRPCQVGHY